MFSYCNGVSNAASGTARVRTLQPTLAAVQVHGRPVEKFLTTIGPAERGRAVKLEKTLGVASDSLTCEFLERDSFGDDVMGTLTLHPGMFEGVNGGTVFVPMVVDGEEKLRVGVQCAGCNISFEIQHCTSRSCAEFLRACDNNTLYAHVKEPGLYSLMLSVPLPEVAPLEEWRPQLWLILGLSLCGLALVIAIVACIIHHSAKPKRARRRGRVPVTVGRRRIYAVM